MSQVIDAILNGQADDELDAVYQAVKSRRELLSKRMLLSLQAGDKVRFISNAKPTYLRGLTATVVCTLDKKALIHCDDDPAFGRFAGSDVRCPTVIIEKIQEAK